MPLEWAHLRKTLKQKILAMIFFMQKISSKIGHDGSSSKRNKNNWKFLINSSRCILKNISHIEQIKNIKGSDAVLL